MIFKLQRMEGPDILLGVPLLALHRYYYVLFIDEAGWGGLGLRGLACPR